MRARTLFGFLFGLLVIIGICGILFAGCLYVVAQAFGTRIERLTSGANVAVIDLFDVIETSDSVMEQIEALKELRSVKAVVVRVDSPGGGVGASQEIFQMIDELREERPVVVSMGSTAASGAFWVAMAGDKVLANPGTLTGSIGVIVQYLEVHRALDRLSLEPITIKTGRYKDTGSPFRGLEPADREMLLQVMRDIHVQFKEVIAERRKLSEQKVAEIADGRVFTGRQAKEYGLVDELGGFSRALRVAAELGKISGEPEPVFLGDGPWYERFLDSIQRRVVGALQSRVKLSAVLE